MNVVVSLIQEQQSPPPGLGDFVRIQIFADEKIGKAGDQWKLETAEGATWIPAGSLTIAADSVKSLPAEGNSTKLEIGGIIHQPGPLTVGPLLLRHENSKREIMAEGTISGQEITASTQEPKDLPWLLPPVQFGGWNWPLIIFLSAAIIGGLTFAVRKLIQKFPGHLRKNLSHTQLALNSLTTLQRHTKTKKALQQEEWKKFSFELAGILRRYSDANWEIDSRDMTDKELLAELRMHKTAAPFVEQLSEILTTITEVRYGRKDLDASIVPGLLLNARKFVEKTTIRPEAEGSK